MAKDQPTRSASTVIFITALDTTWRMFVPILGGTFAGIGLDHLFSSAPIATIVCLVLGTTISAALIIQQLKQTRTPEK